jgi:hypothetical protein
MQPSISFSEPSACRTPAARPTHTRPDTASVAGPSSRTAALPVSRLRPLQRAALSTLSTGNRIACGGLRGVDAADAQHVVAFPTATVQALLRYHFIEQEDDARGVYRATDDGLRALAVLPAW